jgi:spore germination protein GerM
LVLAAGFAVAYYLAPKPKPHPHPGEFITIYYCKLDGTTMVPWRVSLGSAKDPKSVAFYAAVQAVAGPPPNVEAVRFPAGTKVGRLDVNGATAVVDLSNDVKSGEGGSFTESGEFKSLVWTLTGLSGIKEVRVTVAGARLATLPGGHLELDEPLSRANW